MILIQVGMDNSKQEDSLPDEFVDSRTVKTIRSLRKESAKKISRSSKNVSGNDKNENDKKKDFRIVKKKQSTNKSRVGLFIF